MTAKEVTTGYTDEQYKVAVQEYRSKKQDTINQFLNNVIELGDILLRHREKLKPAGQWVKFLEDIGIHLSTANQQIAMSEFVKTSGQKKLLEKVINNWTKMQEFLRLPEDKKQRVLETSKNNKEETTAEFRERVGEVENEDVEVSDHDEDILWSHLEEIAGDKADLQKLDPKANAVALQKELGFSSRTIPVLEALILMAKATELLETSLPKLTEADRKVLGTMFSEQHDAISSISLGS